MRIINANIYTPIGEDAKHGAEMGNICHIKNGIIDITNGIISWVGNAIDAPFCCDEEIIDAHGRAVLPGFVDSHTHLIFAGTREEEFMWRMRGDSYMDIMNRGGGIVNTMNATRLASKLELKEQAMHYLDLMLKMGVTTVEAKSGYGLDYETEIKQLETIQSINNEKSQKPELVATYLGAHAIPPEWKGKEETYIDFMISKVMPAAKQMTSICDVFCEKGVFSIQQSRHLLSEAQKQGFKIKIHADEIVNTGGAELAAEFNALSADHLLHVSDIGIEALAKSNTVATILPITAFVLREPYAPARKLIDSGCAVALASDFNPGSCYSFSIPLIFALACIHMNLSIQEALTAITLNGAAALGKAKEIGSIEPGKRGNIVILNSSNIDMLPYHTGINIVDQVILN